MGIKGTNLEDKFLFSILAAFRGTLMYLLVPPMYSFLHKVQVMQQMTFADAHARETIGDLKRSLRSRYFVSVFMKGQVLHREQYRVVWFTLQSK